MTAATSQVQPSEFVSPKQTAEVLRLYGELAELVNTEDYKVLQAAAKYMRDEKIAAEARKLTDSDDEDEDEVEEEEDEEEPQEIVIDFKEQLAKIQGMDKVQLKKYVQTADKGFSKQFRNIAMQLRALLPPDSCSKGFSDRLLDIINAKLSDADKRIAISPISLQFDTGAATNDELSKLAITWTFDTILGENTYKLKQALAPLGRLFLADAAYESLKTAIQDGEIPELHEDLRLGDLTLTAIDVVVLPFKEQVEEDDSFVANSWAVRTQQDVFAKLRLTEYQLLDSIRTRPSDEDGNYIVSVTPDYFVRRNILDKATRGEFSNKVVAILSSIVKENLTQLVYSCWAYMLYDLYGTVTRCVSDAHEVINPRAAGRLIVKSESNAVRSETGSLLDD